MAGNIDQWDRAGNHRRRSLIRHSALRHLRRLGLAQSMGDRIIPGTGRRADPPRKFPPARYYRSRSSRTEHPMTQAMSRVALYAAVGPELTHYEVDVAAGTLTRRGDVQLPANVQDAWPFDLPSPPATAIDGWRRWIDTSRESPEDIMDASAAPVVPETRYP